MGEGGKMQAPVQPDFGSSDPSQSGNPQWLDSIFSAADKAFEKWADYEQLSTQLDIVKEANAGPSRDPNSTFSRSAPAAGRRAADRSRNTTMWVVAGVGAFALFALAR